jgi:anti-sigma regulatory factor (Ser/Thr protein kinase)
MAGIAADCGMDAEGVADVKLAVTEAATNAVMHAYAEVTGELTVTAAVQGGELEIVIGDSGSGITERRDSPGLGVGLSVIATVAEQLRIVSSASGTQIHMSFRCSGDR